MREEEKNNKINIGCTDGNGYYSDGRTNELISLGIWMIMRD